MRSTWLAIVLGSSVAAVGCGDDDDASDTPTIDGGSTVDSSTPTACPTTGDFTHYVNNKIVVPTGKIGMFDLDGEGRPDNQLGPIINVLKTRANLDIQETIDEAIADGSLIMLHSVQSGSLTTSASASWQVFLGDPITEPKYDGTDVATVKSDSPDDAKLCGTITNGEFVGGPGDVSVQLALGDGDPIPVKLTGARIKGTVTADGCTAGVLGGGITDSELNNSVLPAIANLINGTVADDHPTGATTAATCGAAGACPMMTHDGFVTTCEEQSNLCLQDSTQQVLSILDKVAPFGEVTAQEIKENDIIAQVLTLDVNLIPDSGNVNDSLSIGLEFTCAKATFEAPGE